MLKDILNERQKTHGNFVELSKISQEFKQVIFNSEWQGTNAQREAIDMIVHKLARILNGNSN